MITEHFTFLSADHHTQIHAVKWLPDSRQYHAVLQITHGMTEHIMRYQSFAEFLTGKGFMVIGHDHLGHGATAKDSAALGYFSKSSPSNTLIADMHTLYCIAHQDSPTLPYFMLGHSMGSYLLRKYLSIYQPQIGGALILGTGYAPFIKTLSGLGFLHILAALKGWHYRSPLATRFCFGNSYHRFDGDSPTESNSWLTRDVKIVNQNKADPYANFMFTLNGYRGLLQTVLYSCLQKNMKKIPKSLPVLFAAGEQDPVGDMGKGVKKVCSGFQKAGITNVQCLLYPGARHEILNEINRQEVYSDLWAWLSTEIRKSW